MMNGREMQKATGNHCIKDLLDIPRIFIRLFLIMLEAQKQMASSPGQALSGQEVRRIPRFQLDKMTKIATWNVKTLFAAGKLDNLIQEMNRMKINILGVSEVRWPGSGMLKSKGKVFYYSGNNDDRNHQHGVGILMDENLQKSVKNFVPLSERVIIIQLIGRPININIIQVYAPTADKPEEEVEDFYKQLDQVLKLTKTNEMNIIFGDLNAKVGKGRTGSAVGDWGLGERNDRGERWIQYCEENNLIIANTWFKLPPRRLYTWKSPQDSDQHIVRNQIDYITIGRRFRNSITKVTTMPGADIESDHNPVCASIILRLAKPKRKCFRDTLDLHLLKDERTRSLYEEHLNKELESVISTNDTDKYWLDLKQAFKTTNEKFLPKKSTTAKNEWMTKDVLELMERRRQCKIQNDYNGYKAFQRRIRNGIREAKENWLHGKCLEAELLNRLGDSFHLHKKVKEIAGLYSNRHLNFIKNEHNEIVAETEELLQIWRKYTMTLFNDDRPENPPTEISTLSGPSILKSEITHAIKIMKNNKAPGPDEMYSETFHLINEQNLETIVRLFNNIYETGRFPEDWLRSTFITLPKSNSATSCKDYRLISLMSHFLKLLLRVLHTRLYHKCEEVSGVSQFGFKSGFGTREAIFSLQTLVQNCQDQRKDVFMCFIDYEKAFDNVKHNILIAQLRDLGLDGKDIRLIANLYWHQKAEIRISNAGTSEDFEIKKGVRQGCILSPMLFNLYVEKVFSESISDSPFGIKVNGIPINNIRYADDTVILADNANDLQSLLDRVNDESQRLGLKININKTKFMIVSRNDIPRTQIHINEENIEQVTQFKYLGCMINNGWDPDQEIKCRIERARTTFLKLRKFLTDKNLNFSLRYRMVKCYVWSVLLYGVEAWTLKVPIINKIEAFEMWILRRMLRVSWMDRIRNEDILRRAGLAERELFENIKNRKVGYLGHILRGARYHFQRLILQGKIEGGRRGIGRKKLSWLRNIRQWTGIKDFPTLQNAAINRTI